jgi:hypothetical protein
LLVLSIGTAQAAAKGGRYLHSLKANFAVRIERAGTGPGERHLAPPPVQRIAYPDY